MLIIFVIIIFGGFIAYRSMKVQKDIYNRTGKHPKGYYLNKGLAIGIPLGIPFGIIIDNIAIGISIGVAIGFAIGSAREKKHEDELRPLTKEEEDLNYFFNILVQDNDPSIIRTYGKYPQDYELTDDVNLNLLEYALP